MKTLLILLSWCATAILQDVTPSCPENVSCVTFETPESCPPGSFYRHNVNVNGSCPGCVEGLIGIGENTTCSADAECQPGLACKDDGHCVEDKTNQPCEVAKRSSTRFYIPVCLPDGKFAAKQCKGEKLTGRCFCTDKYGKRIFGEESRAEADDMTCACSRQMAESSRVDASLHCDDRGNFEPLQCEEGLCWCAEGKTGTPTSWTVPQVMMTSLPCYDAAATGSQYLRQCDSIKVNQAKVKDLLTVHGTNNVYFPQVSCNFDGSFARVQIINNKKTCTTKDKTPLNEGVEASVKNVDCNCAYDQYLTGSSFSMSCLPNGNYDHTQHIDGQIYCVDNDGFPTTELGTVPKCL